MDESGNGNPDQPLIVGTVVADIDADEIEQSARELYDQLRAQRALKGLASFEEFCEHGFHATGDPVEVSVLFINLMQRTIGFKAYMLMTESRTVGTSETQQITEMYARLVGDCMIRYRYSTEIACGIEQNQGLGQLVDTLEERAMDHARAKIGIATLPRLSVNMVPKGNSMAMAIVDYLMHAVSRWVRAGCGRNQEERAYRGFRQLEPMISVLYSLERGLVSNRRVRATDP